MIRHFSIQTSRNFPIHVLTSSFWLFNFLYKCNALFLILFQDLRTNLSQTLIDFAQSYNEAIRYQDSYSIEGNTGRFSVYPFPPPSIDTLQTDRFIEPLNPPPPPVQPPIPPPEPLQSRQSLTLPLEIDDISYLFHAPMDMPDTVMDSQIQLHQNMLFQSDYMLSRNRDTHTLPQSSYVDETPMTNSPSTAVVDHPISTILSVPNVRVWGVFHIGIVFAGSWWLIG